ncbi:MAG: LPS export ABC transporter permease LptG [Mariprofundus sp.]|nr:LPS export ABC transporter permease LptG [Mariprofundus sp.]
MPVIFRWIFTGCLSRSLITMAALLSIFVIIESFDKARFLGHGLTPSMMLEYMLLKIPFMLSEFMPIIVLIGGSVYLIELSRNQELVALRAAGLGINKILVPLSTVALLAALSSFAIGEWVTPITNERLDNIETVHIQHKKSATQTVQWLKDGHRFFRLTPLGGQQFSLLMLKTGSDGEWIQRIDSPKASYSNGQWQLQQVRISSPSLEQVMHVEKVERMKISSASGPKTASPPQPGHMKISELYHYIDSLKRAGLQANNYIYTLHRKFSAPLSSLLMIILAAALCLHAGNRNNGASLGLMFSISLGLLFYVASNASYLLAGSNHIHPAFAAWLPSLVFGGSALFLLLKREGY